MWISNAERPLHADELRHALGVKIGSTDLDPEKVPAIQILLGCALGLLTFEKASSTIQLFSYTLQEYLLNNPTLLQSPHPTAEASLTYPNFQNIRNLWPTLDSTPSTAPLLDYTSCYWGSPARKEMTKNANLLT
ncbi:hypothetical protein L873DRAFT_650697 [Choiromyces venosus 120613-1]|uniref:Uncharacterized protein n=1 Tax=Choiromyces venosus 120613-1 TaxID=1336337 RepID=A0A3N4IUL8_9PEZI|nr:hypothetical protein L873DRAFT_650697 [Choiromyces venosus 120613-1]